MAHHMVFKLKKKKSKKGSVFNNSFGFKFR